MRRVRPLRYQAPAASATGADAGREALLKRYCQGCHNERVLAGGLALDTLDVTRVADDAEPLGKVVRKLRAGVMPPAGMPRPTSDQRRVRLVAADGARSAAARTPNPGRTETFHRLNRTEYQNAIRDLLALDIDVADFLPADDSSYGFDNIAGVLKISQSLMERYLAAAKTISRLAVGSPLPRWIAATGYRLSPSSAARSRRGAAVRHARRHPGPSPLPAGRASTTSASRRPGAAGPGRRHSSR